MITRPILEPSSEEGALLARIEGAEVRESTWAGAYYCAHVLWTSTLWARGASSSIVTDQNGDALVGFIHVPADAESGHLVQAKDAPPPRSKRERHAATGRVVACALRGIADELVLAGVRTPRRVLVSGFGPFATVTSNPTGDFVEDDTCMSEAMAVAFGKTPATLGPVSKGGAACHAVDGVVISRVRLNVDDACLDPSNQSSLVWALERFRPHALIGLGIHRASSIYRVEVEPTNAGLADAPGSAPTHERGRPLDARQQRNGALALAITKGARALGFASAP